MSRNGFLARERATSPDRRAPRYQPVTRHNPRRPPTPGWRPSSRPAPSGPLFPTTPRAPIPFGKRVPASPIQRAAARKLFNRMFVKFLPWVPLGAALGEAVQYWKADANTAQALYLTNAGFRLDWDDTPMGVPLNAKSVLSFVERPADYKGFPPKVDYRYRGLFGQVPNTDEIVEMPQGDSWVWGAFQTFIQGYSYPGSDRMTYLRQWFRWQYGGDNGYTPDWDFPPVEFPIPELDPVILPVFDPLPYPYPYAPMPLPVSPPIQRPEPGEQPVFEPASPVRPVPDAPPYLRPRPVSPGRPAVEVQVGPSGRPAVGDGFHEYRPPRGNERERKRNVRPAAALVLGRALVRAAGKVTEAADFIDAVYDSLPAKVRRWKGRDGKWRDRDITPQGKLERIWANSDEINVQKAIENLVKNELEDRFIGKISKRGPNGPWGETGGVSQMGLPAPLQL